jgi:hypothetical protein
MAQVKRVLQDFGWVPYGLLCRTVRRFLAWGLEPLVAPDAVKSGPAGANGSGYY